MKVNTGRAGAARYRAARLTGLGNSMSRLGGGIGTRGPGEKKLEMDRRLIKLRISQFEKRSGAGKTTQTGFT